MRRRKFILASSAALATGGFFTGTGAFTSAEVDRDITVEIVGDGDAYLGLSEDEMPEDGVLFGTDLPRIEPETFDVINQSATEITEMTITLDDENLEFMDVDSPGGGTSVSVGTYSVQIENLSPGQAVTDVKIRIPTSDLKSGLNGTVSDRLLFEVDGPGLYIEAERTLELEPLVQQVLFRGAGGVDITTNAREPFEVLYWSASQMLIDSDDDDDQDDGNSSQANNETDSEADEGNQGLPPGEISRYDTNRVEVRPTGRTLRGALDDGPGYFAVYFPAVDRTYYHPHFVPGTDSELPRIAQWGQGRRETNITDGKLL